MKNRTKITAIILMTLISFLLFWKIAVAQEFSADIVFTTKEGSFTGKIFVTKQKIRIQMPGAITITRIDKNLVWILMPQENIYMEQRLKLENVVATADKMPGEIERKHLGTEIIDGKTTNKYRIVYTVSNEKATILQCIAADSGIPIKVQSEDNSWIFEYKNLKIAPQPDSLFEIPAGYQKFSYEMPSLPNFETEEGQYRFEQK